MAKYLWNAMAHKGRIPASHPLAHHPSRSASRSGLRGPMIPWRISRNRTHRDVVAVAVAGDSPSPGNSYRRSDPECSTSSKWLPRRSCLPPRGTDPGPCRWVCCVAASCSADCCRNWNCRDCCWHSGCCCCCIVVLQRWERCQWMGGPRGCCLLRVWPLLYLTMCTGTVLIDTVGAIVVIVVVWGMSVTRKIWV